MNLRKKIPRNLYRDNKYARGMPNIDIKMVEIEAVIMLKTNASMTFGRKIEFIRSSEFEKVIILVSGYKMYNKAIMDKIPIIILKLIIFVTMINILSFKANDYSVLFNVIT